MRVRIMEEHGAYAAVFGLGLSYGKTSGHDYPAKPDLTGLYDRAEQLSDMGKGHNKFMRQIILWIDCDAPLYWWKQFDQYKVAVCTQSESTMHTLMKNEIHSTDFEGGLPTATLMRLNHLRCTNDFNKLNKELPQSYLQRRIITLSYENMRNIVEQRRGHKLEEWDFFIDSIIPYVKHPEFLCKSMV